MAIQCFTGVPGSGKSYHTARIIYDALRNGINVITNIRVNTSIIVPRGKRPMGQYIFVPDCQWRDNGIYKNVAGHRFSQDKNIVYSYIYGLTNFALNFHARKKNGQMIESQTLIILDECQKIFNPREWNRKDRLEWIKFFTVHRHYGFDVILIAQSDMSIDKQIRAVCETQVIHRNLSKYRKLGKIMAKAFGGNLFITVEKMYGMSSKKDSHIRSKLLFGSSYYFQLYDSFALH